MWQYHFNGKWWWCWVFDLHDVFYFNVLLIYSVEARAFPVFLSSCSCSQWNNVLTNQPHPLGFVSPCTNMLRSTKRLLRNLMPGTKSRTMSTKGRGGKRNGTNWNWKVIIEGKWVVIWLFTAWMQHSVTCCFCGSQVCFISGFHFKDASVRGDATKDRKSVV